MAKNLSDKAAMSSNANANEFVKEGDTIVAKIVSVRKDKFDVELTARQVPSYVEPRAMHDQHWHNRLAEEKAADKSITRSEAKRHFIIKRAIQHPLFHNYDFQQAEEYLAKLPPGEVLFRPSSQGTDYLSLTWKISDGVFQHIEIKESEKEDRNSLGMF
jgi:transcription elongation factor SPT6